VWRDSFICVTWLIHMGDMTHPYYSFIWSGIATAAATGYMCDMTHWYVRHDSLRWLIYMFGRRYRRSHCLHVWHDSFICVTWLIHMCDMTHWCVWHYWFIWVPWVIYRCAMTHSYVCHDSFICVPWLIHMCDMGAMSHLYVRASPLPQPLLTSATWLIHMRDMTDLYGWDDSFICSGVATAAATVYMCDMTHSYVWHDSFICVTCLIHMGDMTHWYVRASLPSQPLVTCDTHTDTHVILVTCVTWLFHITHLYYSSICSGVAAVAATGHMCDMTGSYVWHDLFIWVTWLIDMCDMTHWYV